MYLVGTGRLDGVEIDDERGNSPLITREGAHIGGRRTGRGAAHRSLVLRGGSIENGTTVDCRPVASVRSAGG